MTHLAELLHYPIPQTNVLHKTIRHRSIKLWNDNYSKNNGFNFDIRSIQKSLEHFCH